MTAPQSPRPALTVCTEDNRVCNSGHLCLQPHPDASGLCTRAPNHEGNHVACSLMGDGTGNHRCNSWPNYSQPAPTEGERKEPCCKCGELVADWFDTEWSNGRICQKCYDEYDPGAATQGAALGAAGGEPTSQFTRKDGDEVANVLDLIRAKNDAMTPEQREKIDRRTRERFTSSPSSPSPVAPVAREETATPETDAYLVEHPFVYGVGPSFARSLERRLHVAEAERDENAKWRQLLSEQVHEVLIERDTARAERDEAISNANYKRVTELRAEVAQITIERDDRPPQAEYEQLCASNSVYEREVAQLRAEVARLTRRLEKSKACLQQTYEDYETVNESLAAATARTEEMEGAAKKADDAFTAMETIGCSCYSDPDGHCEYCSLAGQIQAAFEVMLATRPATPGAETTGDKV